MIVQIILSVRDYLPVPKGKGWMFFVPPVPGIVIRPVGFATNIGPTGTAANAGPEVKVT
jgi:hypothetical protein